MNKIALANNELIVIHGEENGYALRIPRPLPTEFSRQEQWSGLPCPSPRDLTAPGIKPGFPESQVDSLLTESPRKPLDITYM